uniref:Uncharacterized protein n=1 Tax=viral metagenome TaxID=1070528 RepID=A0A6C0BQJ7_9ZZZZ
MDECKNFRAQSVSAQMGSFNTLRVCRTIVNANNQPYQFGDGSCTQGQLIPGPNWENCPGYEGQVYRLCSQTLIISPFLLQTSGPIAPGDLLATLPIGFRPSETFQLTINSVLTTLPASTLGPTLEINSSGEIRSVTTLPDPAPGMYKLGATLSFPL